MTDNKNAKKGTSLNSITVFSRMYWILAGVLFLIAIVSAVIGILSTQNSSIVTGTVLDFAVVQNAIPFTEEDSGLHYYPIIQYAGNNGLAEYRSPQPVSPDRLSKGDTVELLITRNNRVYINNLWGRIGSAIVLLLTASVFAVSALATFRLGKVAQNKTQNV